VPLVQVGVLMPV